MRGQYVIVTKNKKGTVSVSTFFDKEVWIKYYEYALEYAKKNGFKDCYKYTQEIILETVD